MTVGEKPQGQDQLIFPELSATDKVQVTSEEAKRGKVDISLVEHFDRIFA
jgi:hypothetical protein